MNGYGVYFYKDTYPNRYSPWLNTPQLVFSSKEHFVTGCNGDWVKLSGIFRANGGETKLCFGNYSLPNTADTLHLNCINNQVNPYPFIGSWDIFDYFELYELPDIKKAEMDYLPCDGSHVPIWASGAEQYLWLDVNHNFISTDSLITIQGEALYYLVTTQCNAVDTIVFDLKYKHLQGQPPPLLPCDGSGAWLQAGGSDNFKWYDGKYINFLSDSSAMLVTLPGTYYVVSDVCGQQDTVRMEVLLQNCDTLPPPEVVIPPEIPNIITPDGNGLNDFLVIKNLQPGSSLSIYNRWGNVLFESKDYQQNWDCNRCSDGTYFYVLITPDGKQYKGSVTVVGEK